MNFLQIRDAQAPDRTSEQAPDATPALTLNRSSLVARDLVHRTALAEVLLTDVRPSDLQAEDFPLEDVRAKNARAEDASPIPARTFTAAAQWTRSHPTFDRTGDGRHNPLLVAETMRQLGIYIPLQFYAVPSDVRFLIEELTFSLDTAAEPRAGYGGSEITCEVRAQPLPVGRSAHIGHARRSAQTPTPQRLRLTVRYLADGREFGQADGTARFLTPSAYAAVRSRRPAGMPPPPTSPLAVPPPTPLTLAIHNPATHNPATHNPALLGISQLKDLLIGLDPDNRIRLLPADPFHPFFYDHPSDHVPGIVLIEAARQAAALQSVLHQPTHRHAATPERRMTACTLRALSFTEPTPPAEIACTLTDTAATFEIRQFGTLTATGSLHFERQHRP